MRSFIPGLFACIILALGAGSASAEEGKIERFLRNTVPIFDEAGKELERVSKSNISVPLAVSGYNDLGYLQVSLEGKTVYIRRADVVFDGPATCRPSAESQRVAQGSAAGTPGMRAGAGSSGRACVPVRN